MLLLIKLYNINSDIINIESNSWCIANVCTIMHAMLCTIFHCKFYCEIDMLEICKLRCRYTIIYILLYLSPDLRRLPFGSRQLPATIRNTGHLRAGLKVGYSYDDDSWYLGRRFWNIRCSLTNQTILRELADIHRAGSYDDYVMVKSRVIIVWMPFII